MKNLNVMKLLLVYFSGRWDHPVMSPLGRDPSASRTAHGDFSRLVGLMCDVGNCLKVLDAEQLEAITYYWSLYFSRMEADATAARLRSNARVLRRLGDERGADTFLKMAYRHHDRARAITSELARHRRRKAFRTGVERLDVELRARDLYGRAAMGEGCGIQS